MKKLIALLFLVIASSCKKAYETSSSYSSYKGPTGNVLIYTSDPMHKEWMYRVGVFGEEQKLPFFDHTPDCNSSPSQKVPARITQIIIIDCYANNSKYNYYPLYASVDSNECSVIDVE